MIGQKDSWSLWLTYLIALRYFLSSLRSISQSVIKSARFIRQAQRFKAFVSAADLAVHSPDPHAVPCPDHVLEAYQSNGDPPVSDAELDDD